MSEVEFEEGVEIRVETEPDLTPIQEREYPFYDPASTENFVVHASGATQPMEQGPIGKILHLERNHMSIRHIQYL